MKVFISYSRKDYLDDNNNPISESDVGRIIDALKRNDIEVWIDIHDHYAGDNVPKKLAKKIREADKILFISSHNSNVSDWVAKEINYASEHKKNIIPLRIDKTPFNENFDILLEGIDYIEYYRNGDKAIEKLLQILNIEAASIKPKRKTVFFQLIKLLSLFVCIFIFVFGFFGSVGFAVGYFENIEDAESLNKEAFRYNQFSAIDSHTLKYDGKMMSFTFDVDEKRLEVIKEKSNLIEYSFESITFATAIPIAFSNLFKSAKYMGSSKTKAGYIIAGSLGIIFGYGVGKPLGKSFAISKNEDALKEFFENESIVTEMKQKLSLIYQ